MAEVIIIILIVSSGDAIGEQGRRPRRQLGTLSTLAPHSTHIIDAIASSSAQDCSCGHLRPRVPAYRRGASLRASPVTEESQG